VRAPVNGVVCLPSERQALSLTYQVIAHASVGVDATALGRAAPISRPPATRCRRRAARARSVFAASLLPWRVPVRSMPRASRTAPGRSLGGAQLFAKHLLRGGNVAGVDERQAQRVARRKVSGGSLVVGKQVLGRSGLDKTQLRSGIRDTSISASGPPRYGRATAIGRPASLLPYSGVLGVVSTA